MRNQKKSQKHPDEPVLRSSGKVFSDGSISELVRIPGGETNFLIWDGKSAETATQFVRDGETFLPPPIDPSILSSLRFPSHSAEYGSTCELFAKISGLISRATQEATEVVQLVTFFLLATWMIGPLPLAPFLWIIVPPTTTSAPLMQMLRLLCRRAIDVNDISAPGVRSLLDLQPTLMTEVLRPSRRLLNLLRESTRRGAVSALGGRFVDTCCAKVVFAREPLRDPESAGFPTELVLSPSRAYISPMSPSEADRIAAEFQPQLLYYRLRNIAKVRAPAFDLNQFTPTMREIAYTLGACIVGDDELQALIVPLLKPVDTEIRVGHASLLNAIALEALLARCHSVTGKYFPVVDLTADVNTVLCGRGEPPDVSPEKMGWVLRGLGLHTDFMPGGRKALVLTNGVREKIHQLAAVYGVRSLRALPAKIECRLCAKLELPGRSASALAG